MAQVSAATDLDTLREAARTCEACPLYKNATQTVFGEGPRHARFVLIGEQPGDAEDREGRPFVGPAGRLLDRALEEAGVDRAECYVTHFVRDLQLLTRVDRLCTSLELHNFKGLITLEGWRAFALATLPLYSRDFPLTPVAQGRQPSAVAEAKRCICATISADAETCSSSTTRSA